MSNVRPHKTRSWHDFHIVSYTAAGKHRQLAFELEWPYGSRQQKAPGRITFTGVECYFLEHDLGGNIVYFFAEASLRKFLEEWQGRFEIECKWGWPLFWRTKPHPPQPVTEVLEEAFNYLSGKSVKCIDLSSSYGLSGWVLATDVEENPAAA